MDDGERNHPDEGTIHAWLDGELPAAESARPSVLGSVRSWARALALVRQLGSDWRKAQGTATPPMCPLGRRQVRGSTRLRLRPTPREPGGARLARVQYGLSRIASRRYVIAIQAGGAPRAIGDGTAQLQRLQDFDVRTE